MMSKGKKVIPFSKMSEKDRRESIQSMGDKRVMTAKNLRKQIGLDSSFSGKTLVDLAKEGK
ncbi:hypothetical protein D3C71_1083290 [compost metagenome]